MAAPAKKAKTPKLYKKASTHVRTDNFQISMPYLGFDVFLVTFLYFSPNSPM